MNPQLTLLFTVSSLFLGLAGEIRAEDGSQPSAVASKKIKELKIGDPAPPLTLMKFVKGEPINRFEKGKVYILVFGYMACPFCRQMYPYLTELQATFPNVAIIDVHVWESEQDTARLPTYVKEIGKLHDYRVAMDADDEMARNWMVAADQNGVPRAFVVDCKGRIVWINHPCLLFDGYRGHGLPDLGKGKVRSTMLEQICSGQWDMQETSDRFAKARQLRGATAPRTERTAVQAMREMGAVIKQNAVGAPVSEVAFFWEKKLLTDAGMKELRAFKELEQLNLNDTHITDVGLREIKGLKTLQTLALNHTQVTDAGLRELGQLKQLENLYLGDTRVTDAGLKELGRFKQLQQLNLGGTRVTDAGLKELGQCKQLKALFLHNTRVTGAGLKKLQSLKKLQTLTLDKSKVTDAGMNVVKGLKGLRVLSVNGVEITDAGLEGLQGFDNLQQLWCRKTQVTGGGLKGFKALQNLYLNGSPVTDEGMKGLESLKELKKLDLSGTKITDAGLKELRELRNLTELYLNNTRVTDAGLKELQAMTGLKKLFLEGARVTEAAARNLRKVRPDLRITIVDD